MQKRIIIGVIILVILILLGYVALFAPSINISDQTASTTPQPSATACQPVALGSKKPEIQDEKVGTGPAVKVCDTVTVNYKGTLPDGTVFDQSYGKQPFTFQVGTGQVIKGWDIGLQGMKVGGKRKLVIPPDLGYGNQAAGSIPPNSTLTFEIELLSIK